MKQFDEINSFVESAFNSTLICASLFGSRARGEHHPSADFDLIIITNTPVSLDQKSQFNNALRDYCLEYKYEFDQEYPAEIVYYGDLEMSMQGYGFVRKGSEVLVPTVFRTQWTAFNSYRQWLAAFATPSVFLCGDNDAYKSYRSRAAQVTLNLVLFNFAEMSFNREHVTEKLIGKGKEYLGFLDTPATRMYVKRTYWPILEMALKTDVVRSRNDQLQVVNPEALLPPYIKDYKQYELEQQYLSVHESSESWQYYMQRISDLGMDSIETDQPLIYKSPQDLKSLIDTVLPDTGMTSLDQLASEMKKLQEYSINQNSPNYVAFPDAGNSKAAITAAMMMPLWNQNLVAVDKSAPVGTFVETQVIGWLRQLIGYDCETMRSAENVGGIATTGGVMANTVGLLVARSKALPASRSEGLIQSPIKPYLLIADKTLEHYSHKAAFWWLGLGENNVIPVKAAGYNFDISDLKKKLAYYNSDNRRVMAVVCLAGDSRTMTIQNIKEIYGETSKYETWLHLDACHGGIGLFSSSKEELCRDYHLADSISIDPHKGLALPYSASFCLFKDQHALRRIAKSTDITIALGSFDMGQVTPFLGSRPFDALKLWALIKYHGMKGLQAHVDRRIELASKWGQLLQQSRYFTPLHEPQLTAVSFSISPRKVGFEGLDPTALGILNKALHDYCYQQGWLIIHSYDLIDFANEIGLESRSPLRVLGTNFGNIGLDEAHLSRMLLYLEDYTSKLLSQSNQVADLAKSKAVKR